MDVRPIDYAPPLPMHKRRHVRRRVIAITSLLIGIPIVWYAGPRAWRHAELLYWQNQAMNYSPPADQVVFDNDPGRVRQLLRSPEFELVPEYVSTVIRAPIPCERFFELASPPGINMGFGTLFLHERRNSKGERRLVLLRLGGPVMRSLHSEDPAMNEPLVFRPGTAFSDPIEVRSRWTGSTDLPYGLGGRWFAGQIETDDPSHFSVVNENYGRRFIIDGWLMDDDTIKLEKRR